MQKITEVAKRFEEHAKTQNEAIEKTVKAEFVRLRSVIEQESESVLKTYEYAIAKQRERAAKIERTDLIQSTLRAIPLTVLLTSSLVLMNALWVWYVFRSETRQLANMETMKDGSRWARCAKIWEDPKDKTQPYCLLVE